MESKAVLGGGCFWCLDAVFSELKGVSAVDCGYSGGHRPHPSYAQVCTGTTHHAEVIRVSFDETQISFSDLLDVFFTIHDPTTPNQQGHDIGTQYRSVIFCQNSEQLGIAKEATARAQQIWKDRIVTEIVYPAAEFYMAEDEHQDYFRKHPDAGYCSVVIAPKVVHFRKQWQSRLKH
ncbi:MAG: peptide-methionine (S)-S-oxide reductase MsrA [Deinococcaceae bacterium]